MTEVGLTGLDFLYQAIGRFRNRFDRGGPRGIVSRCPRAGDYCRKVPTRWLFHAEKPMSEVGISHLPTSGV